MSQFLHVNNLLVPTHCQCVLLEEVINIALILYRVIIQWPIDLDLDLLIYKIKLYLIWKQANKLLFLGMKLFIRFMYKYFWRPWCEYGIHWSFWCSLTWSRNLMCAQEQALLRRPPQSDRKPEAWKPVITLYLFSGDKI